MRGLYLGSNRVLVQSTWGAPLIVPADDLSLAPELILNGAIEPPLTKFLIQTVKSGYKVLDVGANFGYYSVMLGHLVGPAGQVVAVEANPSLAPILFDNLSINYLHDRVQVVSKAAYSQSCTLPFFRTKRFQGNSSIHRHDEAYFQHYNDEVAQIEVEAEPLDTLFKDLERVDLIKMDIEGGEYHALLGLRQALSQGRIGEIIFELNRAMLQDDWNSMGDLLRDIAGTTGKAYFTITNDGVLQSVGLDDLLRHGACPHVVLR